MLRLERDGIVMRCMGFSRAEEKRARVNEIYKIYRLEGGEIYKHGDFPAPSLV